MILPLHVELPTELGERGVFEVEKALRDAGFAFYSSPIVNKTLEEIECEVEGK